MNRDPSSIIRRPILTERASELQESGKYVFEVRRDANKIEIGKAAQRMFDVDVVKVNTLSVRGKLKRLGRFQGRKAAWKKAVITIAEGQTIELFEDI